MDVKTQALIHALIQQRDANANAAAEQAAENVVLLQRLRVVDDEKKELAAQLERLREDVLSASAGPSLPVAA
ncbi:MAG: hypothetical protein ACREUF_11525 [Solimonas sp.]